MCALTIVLLIFPGSPLNSLWTLNPDARVAFQSLGKGGDLAYVCRGSRLRFRSHRAVAKIFVGNTDSVSYSVTQYFRRSVECGSPS